MTPRTLLCGLVGVCTVASLCLTLRPPPPTRTLYRTVATAPDLAALQRSQRCRDLPCQAAMTLVRTATRTLRRHRTFEGGLVELRRLHHVFHNPDNREGTMVVERVNPGRADTPTTAPVPREAVYEYVVRAGPPAMRDHTSAELRASADPNCGDGCDLRRTFAWWFRNTNRAHRRVALCTYPWVDPVTGDTVRKRGVVYRHDAATVVVSAFPVDALIAPASRADVVFVTATYALVACAALGWPAFVEPSHPDVPYWTAAACFVGVVMGVATLHARYLVRSELEGTFEVTETYFRWRNVAWILVEFATLLLAFLFFYNRYYPAAKGADVVVTRTLMTCLVLVMCSAAVYLLRAQGSRYRHLSTAVLNGALLCALWTFGGLYARTRA